MLNRSRTHRAHQGAWDPPYPQSWHDLRGGNTGQYVTKQLHIQVLSAQRILFDKFAARFNYVAH